MAYLIYLRKSRADKEAEARGEGETLARHERLLLELAVKMKLNIGAIYKEIVSGETISSRPKMQQLLVEVMQGQWEGVLVMEIERLARGDTKDQGTVAEAFKFSNTKIITPVKTYDPQNEYDEEYFEFGLFMSRREYKTINRRIQRGRIAAFQEGWYISGTAPYGYEKIKRKGDKGYTLSVVENQAAVVRMIFDLYTYGEALPDGGRLRFGSYQIRDRLNALQIPSPSGSKWSASSIMDVIRNPIYSGYQRWSWRKISKDFVDGQIIIRRPKDDDCPKVRGRFEPIISEEQYNKAQKIRESKPTPAHATNALQNPLTGLVYCAKCGTMMTRQPSNTKEHYAILRCPNSRCDNVSAPIYLIEQKLLDGLVGWLQKYTLDWPEEQLDDTAAGINALQQSIGKLRQKQAKLTKQVSSAYDLLEQGVYTIDIFRERLNTLEGNKKELTAEIERLENELTLSLARAQAQREFVPAINHIIDTYWNIDDPQTKNTMLRGVLEKIDYLKSERNKKGMRDTANFILNLYPRIPETVD